MWLEKSIFDIYSFLNFSIYFNLLEFWINIGRVVKIYYGNLVDLRNEKWMCFENGIFDFRMKF